MSKIKDVKKYRSMSMDDVRDYAGGNIDAERDRYWLREIAAQLADIAESLRMKRDAK